MAEMYCNPKKKEAVRRGEYILSEMVVNINKAHALILRLELLHFGSVEQRRSRRVYEGSLANSGILVYANLPLPYGSGAGFSPEDLMAMDADCYRPVVRSIAIIQQKKFATNNKASGPMISSFGITALLRGDNQLISVANGLRV